jgi:hypothetical protein
VSLLLHNLVKGTVVLGGSTVPQIKDNNELVNLEMYFFYLFKRCVLS